MRIPRLFAFGLSVFLLPWLARVQAQVAAGTAFTYQGQLTVSGAAASGAYDLEFRLFNDATAGIQVGSALLADDWPVDNGLFTVQLDFGPGAFTGYAMWLQIAVRPGGSTGAYTTLLPRQAITAAPYALYALSSPNAGDITAVTAGAGLMGGGTSGNVNMAVSFGGTGSATTVARSDHNHDAAYVNVAEANSITSAMIVNGTIIAADLVDGACLAEIIDDDGAGSGLDADLLDGQHASGFATAAHNHDATYFTEAEATATFVNAAGDIVTGPLSLTTDQSPGLSGSSSSTTARGVYGAATNSTSLVPTYGGYFEAASRYGTGVYGQSAGLNGDGVRGEASSTAVGTNHGGYFRAAGTSGHGVYGEATGTGAVTNYGGYFKAGGDSGRAVYAEATSTAGTNYGGYFTAEGASAHAVHGVVSGASANAVYGENTNAGGSGIYPTAGYFRTTGTNGRPVYGRADGDGDTRAVYGHATNTGAVTNYGGFFRSYGQTGQAVHGEALSEAAGATNYGGYFRAQAENGRGLYAESTGTGSTAGYFVSAGNLGVYAETTNTGATNNASAGMFVSEGGNGTGVTGQANGATGTGVYGYVSQSGAKAVRGENFYSHQIGWLGGGDYAVKAQGDLVVTGAYRGTIGPNNGAPFPRPAYDSGWVAIAKDTWMTLTHNIGGDPEDYVIDMQFKNSSGVRNVMGHGIDFGGNSSDDYRGALWKTNATNNTTIEVYRGATDTDASYVRIRIWVAQ